MTPSFPPSRSFPVLAGHLSTTLESVAYAGMDLPVHLALGQAHADGSTSYRTLTLGYPAFQRMLREQADRRCVVELLKNLGNMPLTDPVSGLRCWGQVPCRIRIGTAQLRNTTPSSSPLTNTLAA